MRMSVAIGDVQLDVHKRAAEKKPAPRPAPAPTPAIETQLTTDGRAGARTPDRTLDLRGERVDDAIAQIDRFLDEGMQMSRDVVFIVHGHGTGVLRSAVRDHVKKHPAVSKARAGEVSEGGDGVTVVFLKD
jgi:DNA mismatch repair protein MutS2